MAAPLTTTEFLTAILAAINGVSSVDSVGAGIGTPDPSPSSTGTTTVNNWRSRGLPPQTVDGASGKRLWLVPAGREWQLMGLSATYQSSNTVGDRRLEVFFNPAENDLTVYRHRFPAGAVQAASLAYTYNFSMGGPLLTAAANNFLSVPLPPSILAPGSTICVWDRAQIAPSGDTWSNVQLLLLERVIA